MMEFIIWTVILILGLAGLMKGADWFTIGAEAIGIKLKIPQFIIGATIVSLGTSLPELASSIAGVLQGASEIVVANVAGSNIANILFVLGITAVIGGEIVTKRNTNRSDFPIMLAMSIILLLFSLNGTIGILESLFFIMVFIWYLYRIFQEKETVKIDVEYDGIRSIVSLLLGIFLVIVSAKFLVEAIIFLATNMNIDSSIIAASVVAFGTSIPEAVVTLVAVLKKKKEIALGNIIGSNIFNILLIVGVSGLFTPLIITSSVLQVTLPIMILSTIIFWFMLRDKKITRKEGIILLALYVCFLGFLFA